MKTLVMIHDDWELYGDGSGSLDELMIRPGEKALDACDGFGAKYTFFAEIGQQLAMKNSSDAEQRHLAASWETFLEKAVQRGHDVQLHFHPQWIGARFEHGRWILNFEKWAIGKLPVEDIKHWLGEGKSYLEKLLRPVSSDYEVVCYRAGGWAIQPAHNVLKTLKQLGIRGDATVIKGLKIPDPALGPVDFSAAPSRVAPWFPGADVTEKDSRYDGLFCLPTYADQFHLPVPLRSLVTRPGSIFFNREMRRAKESRPYKPSYQSMSTSAKTNHGSALQRLFRARTVMCDFNEVDFATIVRMVKQAISEAETLHMDVVPFILYTHSKSFFSDENLKRLLAKLSRVPNLEFHTTRHVVRLLDQRFRSSQAA